MSDIIKELSKPIEKQDLALTVKRVERTQEGKFKGMFVINKTSRSVYKRFNEVLGLGWKDEYEREGHNLVCTLSVREEGEWISRKGVGTPSNIESVKGEYSDALKRASVAFGHGSELYQIPNIFIDLSDKEAFKTKWGYSINPYKVNLKLWKFELEHDESGRIEKIKILDEKGRVRWEN